MTSQTLDQILQIYEYVRCSEETHLIWETYEQSHIALYSWMDTLSEEDWTRIDDMIHAFFDVHMEMMSIALTKK